MGLEKKVAFNTGVQVVAKMVTVFFTLLTTILLTNYLGISGFGNYIFVITLMVMFGAVADWGTMTIGIRELARDQEKEKKTLASLFCLKLLLAILAVFLLNLFIWLTPLKLDQLVLLRQTVFLISFFLIFKTIKDFFGVIFQAKLQMQKQALTDIAASGLILLLSWFFINLGLSVTALILAYLLSMIAGLILAGFLAFKAVKIIFQPDWSLVKKLFQESLPMGAILMLFTMDNKVDTVFLGAIKGSEAVGIYGLAYRVYDVLILGAAFLMNSLLPVLAHWAKEKKLLQKTYQQAFDVLLLGGLTLVILTWFLSPLIIRVLTQQRFAEFENSVLILRTLGLAMFFAYFNHLTGYTLVALGKQRRLFGVALGALVFNLTLNFIFIPRFSYYAAAGITVVTEIGVLLATTILVFKMLKFTPSLTSWPQTAKKIFKKATKGAF